MDRLRVGRSIRAIRIRLGWRQSDLALRSGVSRSLVSKVERGLIRHSDLDRIDRICSSLGADLDVRVRWRGEGLDRLLDEAHAALTDRVVSELKAAGWALALEVTFNEYGERGSIDVLAWHASTSSLVVVEVKSVIPDAQATLLPLDRKARLAARIARDRGWTAQSVSRLLVVADQTVNRRRVDRFGDLFSAALPVRGHAVRRWLRSPSGETEGLLFLSDSPVGSTRRTTAGRQRVNRPRISPSRGG